MFYLGACHHTYGHYPENNAAMSCCWHPSHQAESSHCQRQAAEQMPTVSLRCCTGWRQDGKCWSMVIHRPVSSAYGADVIGQLRTASIKSALGGRRQGGTITHWLRGWVMRGSYNSGGHKTNSLGFVSWARFRAFFHSTRITWCNS